MPSLDHLRLELIERHKTLKSWRKVGDEFGGVSPATARRVAVGYEPMRQVIREALGLPQTAPIIVNIEVPPGTELPPNAVIIQCANPDCRVWFVRCHPRQKYCRKEHRR
jgi:hypothetical protein